MSKPSYERILRRSLLPQVLYDSDIAIALRLPVAQAHRDLTGGRFGQPLAIGARCAVLRDDFLEALSQRGRTAEVSDATP